MFESELQDIIDSVDIVEYINQYIDVEEQNGEMFGLSPFQSEITPSFSITPETQLFYDFSSGKGGSILTFIQLYHKCSMREAIKILKEYANITDDTEYVDKRLSATKTIKKFRQVEFKRKKMGATKKALPTDIMQQYENDRDKLFIWSDEGISYDVMEKYQVRYDPFSDRIVFPIRDLNGNIISIKGRTLDPEYKEKRLRKYTYFQRIGELDLFFGYFEHYDEIIKQREVIIYEGEKSVMLAETWGIKNTLAMLTSHLNPLQLPILIKLGVRVVFALDNNVDVRQDENIMKLKRFLKIEYVRDTSKTLREKDAPVDFGLDFWNQLYNERRALN